MFDSKKCLIFCPSFFSYDVEIKESVERNGYEVSLFDERPFKSVVGKSLVRLGIRSITKYCIDKYYKDIFDSLDRQYEVLLIVNPECITPEIIEMYRKKCKHVIIYMWDSFKNKRGAADLIRCSDSFYTFDPCDAKNNNIKFKPLFYVPDYICKPLCGAQSYDVSFIGTAHSTRFKFIHNISNGHKNFLFFYCPSKIVFCVKKYLFKELSGMQMNDVNFVPLHRKEVINILKSSKAIIDIAHPLQQGLTMRTIESIGCQRKLITTNRNVKSYDFYNESNVLIIDKNTNAVEVCDFLNSDYVPVSEDIYSKYFIDNWVHEIFEEVTGHD